MWICLLFLSPEKSAVEPDADGKKLDYDEYSEKVCTAARYNEGE
jgi:hypothetical protein